MPRKPNRPCSYPGCPRLCDGQFCDEHSKLEAKRYNRYDRDPETAKRYNTEWRRIRRWYASAHPLCEECLRAGRYTPTQVVHHILPLREGGTNAESNLMALCHACHGRIHAERGDRWHKKVETTSKSDIPYGRAGRDDSGRCLYCHLTLL